MNSTRMNEIEIVLNFPQIFVTVMRREEPLLFEFNYKRNRKHMLIG